jgi:CRISPR-associated exonuclease Cas4
MDLLIPLAAVLVVLAFAALWSASRQRKAAGLPEGRVVAADTGAWQRLEKPLYDPETGLTGRPDYVVEQDDEWIPVEVKSGWAPPEPHESHIFQLAAYCLLVEHVYGTRPSHGILHYRNRTFEIDYTPALEDELRDLLDQIRLQAGKRSGAPRSHSEAGRCLHCGFRKVCDQKL